MSTCLSEVVAVSRFVLGMALMYSRFLFDHSYTDDFIVYFFFFKQKTAYEI